MTTVRDIEVCLSATPPDLSTTSGTRPCTSRRRHGPVASRARPDRPHRTYWPCR